MSSSPYFDVLFRQLAAGDNTTTSAFGVHVHWGYWPAGTSATLTGEDFGAAAERLCDEVVREAEICEAKAVLDVGCGFGGAVAMLNQRFDSLTMTGVNIDERQLQRASASITPRASNSITWQVGDACDLPLPEGPQYDAILAIECIFHFASRAAFFREAASRLLATGRLVISDFVPSESLANYLRRNSDSLPGAESLRASYGDVNLKTSLNDYHQLAQDAELQLIVDRDITPETLPTYEFLLSHLQSWPDPALGERFRQATEWLAAASRRGMLTYRILAFEPIHP